MDKQEREKFMSVLKDETCGTAEDKIRLVMLFCDSLEPQAALDELSGIERCVFVFVFVVLNYTERCK
jgi:hypothetical protein